MIKKLRRLLGLLNLVRRESTRQELDAHCAAHAIDNCTLEKDVQLLEKAGVKIRYLPGSRTYRQDLAERDRPEPIDALTAEELGRLLAVIRYTMGFRTSSPFMASHAELLLPRLKAHITSLEPNDQAAVWRACDDAFTLVFPIADSDHEIRGDGITHASIGSSHVARQSPRQPAPSIDSQTAAR